ncbi:MAG: hypothetical protein AAF518_25690 [Spirochaetota bacterium]
MGKFLGYALQISPQADFSTITKEETSTLQSITTTLNLQPGDYFWRIALRFEKQYSCSGEVVTIPLQSTDAKTYPQFTISSEFSR